MKIIKLSLSSLVVMTLFAIVGFCTANAILAQSLPSAAVVLVFILLDVLIRR